MGGDAMDSGCLISLLLIDGNLERSSFSFGLFFAFS